MKFDQPTLVTITGPTASGKNYLRDGLEQILGWTRIVSTTTRAPRAGEVQNVDYNFISQEVSEEMEQRGQFAELVTFRGVRYGVTKTEMIVKLHGPAVPMVILEPEGVSLYRKLCAENNWNMYSIYVHTQDDERLSRLNFRTSADLQEVAVSSYENKSMSIMNRGNTFEKIEKIIRTHTDRILSATTEERRWMTTNIWDAVVPGDDFDKAVQMIKDGVEWQNKKTRTPAPYTHVA